MQMPGWRKLWSGAHIENMKDDFSSNTVYYSKEGTLIKHGVPPHQGEHTDIMLLKHHLDLDKRPMEIADEVEGMFGTVDRCERFSENYFEYKRHTRVSHDRNMPK